MKKLLATAPLAFLLVACASSNKPLPTVDEIQHYEKLGPLMKTQARAADPLFKKINGDWSQADWARVAESAQRLQAAGGQLKTKFSRGPEWNGYAETMETQATALSTAATNKDAAAAKAALVAMKQSCKTCHSKLR